MIRQDIDRKQANQVHSHSGERRGTNQETERKRVNKDTYELKETEGGLNQERERRRPSWGERTF